MKIQCWRLERDRQTQLRRGDSHLLRLSKTAQVSGTRPQLENVETHGESEFTAKTLQRICDKKRMNQYMYFKSTFTVIYHTLTYYGAAYTCSYCIHEIDRGGEGFVSPSVFPFRAQLVKSTLGTVISSASRWSLSHLSQSHSWRANCNE